MDLVVKLIPPAVNLQQKLTSYNYGVFLRGEFGKVLVKPLKVYKCFITFFIERCDSENSN
jgi:hypothetical protein